MSRMAKIKKQDMESKFYVQSVQRALTIVDELSRANQGLSLSEIAEKIDLPVSTVYRIVQNLVAWDYIREREDGNYVLGFTLLELGNKVQDNLEIRNIARKYMEQLNRETKETIYLAVLDKKNGEIIYVEKMESLHNIKLAASVGTRNYIHSTANGKCLVSGLSDEKIIELLSIKGMPALTEKTVTSLPEFLKEVKEVRQKGYAVDDLENEPGVRCVAAPIIDFNKNVVAALSISGVESNISLESIEQSYSNLVKEAALKISRQLGHRQA